MTSCGFRWPSELPKAGLMLVKLLFSIIRISYNYVVPWGGVTGSDLQNKCVTAIKAKPCIKFNRNPLKVPENVPAEEALPQNLKSRICSVFCWWCCRSWIACWLSLLDTLSSCMAAVLSSSTGKRRRAVT